MPDLILKYVPEDLYAWLRARGLAHGRSVAEAAVGLLGAVHGRQPPRTPRAGAGEILAINRRAGRSEDRILGYGKDGLPR